MNPPPAFLRVLRVAALWTALVLPCAAADRPVELLLWDTSSVPAEAVRVAATQGDAAVEREGESGFLFIGDGLRRGLEPLETTFLVNFASYEPVADKGVVQAIEAGEYMKIVLRGASGRRLSLSELRLRVGISNPELKLVVVSNRTGLADRGRLPFVELGDSAISTPDPLWKGGTVYTVDLSKRPELQNIPSGELIEFYLVPVDVVNRYAYWGLSSRHSPAIVIKGFDAPAS